MRKLLAVILSICLVLTSGVVNVYAKEKPNKHKNAAELKGKLKQYYKDKDKSRELMRELLELKRENNDYSIPIFVRGEELDLDVPPVIKSGRTLIPLRAVSGALGAEIRWDDQNNTVIIIRNQTIITLKNGSTTVEVNRTEIKLEVTAEIINGRMMVPLRFIAEVFKIAIDWDDLGIIIIGDDIVYPTPLLTPTPTPIITPTPTPTPTPLPSQYTRYEAENAVLAGGASIDDNHTGYSGTGFVNGFWNVGASVAFTVNTAYAGYHNVTLRYANSTGAERSLSLYVNGSKVTQTRLANLANWNTWGEKTDTLNLNAGANTIMYKYDSGDSGNVNLDCIIMPIMTGSLNGSSAAVSGNVSLSSQGAADWVHWGLGSASGYNRMQGVTQQISNFSRIGSSDIAWFGDNPVSYSWSGGNPVQSVSGTTTAIYVTGLSNGFQLTVPADSNLKTLKLYLGAWKAKGKLEAVLSDGSAAPYVEYFDSPYDAACKAFTLNYKAPAAGRILTIRYTVDATYGDSLGNITLQAATLK